MPTDPRPSALTFPALPGLVLLAAFLLGAPIADARAGPEEIQPETGTGRASAAPARGWGAMAATANQHATEAAWDLLARGGSAIDAAIGAQMMLNLVEPQSSGIGGGAFLLYFDAASGQLHSYDGRETAPAAATESLFLKPDGTAPGYFDALVGGNATGVPGLVAMLADAHAAHGTLTWAELFDPAIDLAESGFRISPRLHTLASRVATLKTFETTARYFLNSDGSAKTTGTLLRNLDFAETLRRIAGGGADAFYRGALARDIVAAVRTAPVNPGHLTEADIAAYRAKERDPVCLDYRAYRVCGMGPPSSGGITVLQILGMLERFALAELDAEGVAAAHLFAEASRLAFADRDLYIADPDFVDVPVPGLLDKDYLARRAARIDPARTLGPAPAGVPEGARAEFIPADSPELPATSHITIVDTRGNVAAMTTSIEFAFGSALMVRGFLLNNQLTDFSYRPGDTDGAEVANRVGPGKRPRSSMAPTIVFDAQGKPVLALGSPGGSRIICYVAHTLIAVLDWGYDVQQAIDRPHLCNRNGTTDVEAGPGAEARAEALRARGHEVSVRDMNSGLHIIALGPKGLRGAADPRREGVAAGF